MFLPEHGGALRRASQYYQIPLRQWLDLSTGINPHAWPLPQIPHEVWQRLPEQANHLNAVAGRYYRAPHVLAVPGTQAAIQRLPHLLRDRLAGKQQALKVLIPDTTYGEHEKNWRRAGCQVETVDWRCISEAIPNCQVLVLVNPNNPTGQSVPRDILLQWQQQLRARGGCLVVDEAFMDCQTADNSLAPYCDRPGLVVLRSFGKFFGLAGMRLGFILAEEELCAAIEEELGPWSVSHPAQFLAALALEDTNWQKNMRKNLHASCTRLGIMLKQNGLVPQTGDDIGLFHWFRHANAHQIYDRLARQGILLRLFKHPLSLRIGLPGSEQEWQRLELSLNKLSDAICAV